MRPDGSSEQRSQATLLVRWPGTRRMTFDRIGEPTIAAEKLSELIARRGARPDSAEPAVQAIVVPEDQAFRKRHRQQLRKVGHAHAANAAGMHESKRRNRAMPAVDRMAERRSDVVGEQPLKYLRFNKLQEIGG